MARAVAIGIQDFGDLIQKKYFYIDSTHFTFDTKRAVFHLQLYDICQPENLWLWRPVLSVKMV